MLASSSLGEILVDGQGRTVYGFTPDIDKGGEVTCYDTCAGNWPPLVAPDEITVGEGLDDSDFTAVPRTDDKGDQVSVGDIPLYYFAGDSGPGQTNGQNVGGKWFVVGADGQLIKDAPGS